MREVRFFKGEGDEHWEKTWSAYNQALSWIAGEASRGLVIYREVDLFAPFIVVATIGYP